MAKQLPNDHIVLVPSPGMGHLIPLIQLANRILEAHEFTISFIIPTESPPSVAQKAALEALPSAHTDYHFLPPVNLSDLPQDTKPETKISLTMARSLPALRSHLQDLSRSHHLAVLVVDLFGTDAFDLCPEFGMKPYIFFTTTAMCLSFFLHFPELDARVSCEYREMTEPWQLPGCVPVHGRDFVDPVQDRKNDAYKWFLHHCKGFGLAEGILVNTFNHLEEGAIKALQEPGPGGKPAVYPVGPLVRCGSSEDIGSECVQWLDVQPHGSVLYVCFGSGGTLSCAQLTELAYGLEMSEVRFLWVVKIPNDKVASATYFNIGADDQVSDPLNYLPKGFLERTKGRGQVVRSWAPQLKVLSHKATGGFLTHCGWNSILESVTCGIPLIAWPLYAEQKMNAVMLTEDLEVALRPMANDNGLVERMEIVRVVKGLMVGNEGVKIRDKMKDLKDKASQVLSEDGLSTKALSEVATKWKSHG